MPDPNVLKKLKTIAGEDRVRSDEPMAAHTTFRVGGPADYYICPPNRKALIETVRFCRREELPFFIIGNGSNLLVSDTGCRGVIIEVGKDISEVTGPVRKEAGTDADGAQTDGYVIRAEAGILLSVLARSAAEMNLAGLEFASGIPGTLGGAVFMNAGAYGGEMAHVVKSADVLTDDDQLETWTAEQLAFGYRRSAVRDRGAVVLSAELELVEGDRDEIFAKMDELNQRRRDKQPLDYPSAGSTFKRPEGYFAGKLIMDAGLRVLSSGGAAVSDKHCGFIINKGGATAADIRHLITYVAETVYQASGVKLEPEVRFLGDFD